MAFKKDHYLVLKHYVRLVREHVEAETDELEERLFLTMSGNEYTRVNDALQSFAQSQGIKLPSATIQRKVIPTEAAATLDDAEMRQLASQMSYTVSTARRHYQLKNGREQAAKSLQVIKKLSAQRKPWYDSEYSILDGSRERISLVGVVVANESKGKRNSKILKGCLTEGNICGRSEILCQDEDVDDAAIQQKLKHIPVKFPCLAANSVVLPELVCFVHASHKLIVFNKIGGHGICWTLPSRSLR